MIIENNDIPRIFFKWVTINSREYFKTAIGQCHSVPLEKWDKFRFLELLLLLDRHKAIAEYLSLHDKIYTGGWRPDKKSAAVIAERLLSLHEDIRKNGQLEPAALIEGPPGGEGRYVMDEGHHRAATCYFLGKPLKCEVKSAGWALEAEWAARKANGFICYQSIFVGGEEIVVGHRNQSIGNDSLTRMGLVRDEDLVGKRVLNLGCNHGHDSFMAAEKGTTEVVGIEIDSELVNYALRVSTYYGLNCDFLHWDLGKPFRSKTFDTALCFSVFDHVNRASLLETLRGAKVVYFEGHWMPKPEKEHRSHYGSILNHFSNVDLIGQLGPNAERNVYRCQW